MQIWRAGRFTLDLGTPRVMGIVNVTPDSFSDGGRFLQVDAARAHCDRLVAEGADILDLGAESTRPGSQPPSVQEQVDRLLPVIEHAVTLGIAVSIDASEAAVFDAALAAGADIANDVRALQLPGAMDAITRHPGTGVCLMHMQGEPATMQVNPDYPDDDVVGAVRTFLSERLAVTVAAGVAPECITLDPGYGFGKTHAHSLELTLRQNELLGLGRPLLIGWSRKGYLGKLTGRDAADRAVASVAAALACVARGASVVRVHDVRETVDALKVWNDMGGLIGHGSGQVVQP